jgi:serine/threonine protein kinase
VSAEAPGSRDTVDAPELARRFWELWQQAPAPDLSRFLEQAGPLAPISLAAVLCVELRERWRKRERIPAEYYLRAYPAVLQDREAALDIVYCEFLVRDGLGEAPSPAEYAARFPELEPELGNQIGMHRAMEPSTSVTSTVRIEPDAQPGAAVEPLLSGYRFLEELGRGAMGVVYKARQAHLNRIVAVKTLLDGHLANPEAQSRFLAEAEATAAIKHPNVVHVYDFGTHLGRPFLAMEYLPGGTLAQRLRKGRMPPQAAAELVGKLARAIQAAHDSEIVHRDLKSANVLFDETGEPRVTDFGLARRGEGAGLTMTHVVLGTPAYMAPEQARGETKSVGPTADVYALGVILYECLAGSRPFTSYDPLSLLRQATDEQPEALRQRVPEVPRDLEKICMKCLAKEPAHRYQTTGALADDLARFLAGEGVTARSTLVLRRPNSWPRKYLAVTATGLVVLAAIVAGFISGKFRHAGGDVPTNPPVAPAADLLQPGSRWTGRIRWLPDLAEGSQATVVIASRDGSQFTGDYSANEQAGHFEWRIAGTIDEGQVRWRFTEAIHEPLPVGVVEKASVHGTINGDTLDVLYTDADSSAKLTLKLEK